MELKGLFVKFGRCFPFFSTFDRLITDSVVVARFVTVSVFEIDAEPILFQKQGSGPADDDRAVERKIESDRQKRTLRYRISLIHPKRS